MGKIIWKYILKDSENFISMPKGANILTAKEQNEDICIWAKVDPTVGTEERFFRVIETDYEFYDGGLYIGTAFLQSGSLVFHVFETISA